GTRHALLVGPNSGYGLDNSCMLDTIARGAGRYRGIAVVANDATLDELQVLKREGVVGVAWNVTHYGLDYYLDAKPLLKKLVALDHCLWASDSPYLRAAVRVDYGVLLHLALTLFPDASDRRKLLWDTPCKLLGFAS